MSSILGHLFLPRVSASLSSAVLVLEQEQAWRPAASLSPARVPAVQRTTTSLASRLVMINPVLCYAHVYSYLYGESWELSEHLQQTGLQRLLKKLNDENNRRMEWMDGRTEKYTFSFYHNSFLYSYSFSRSIEDEPSEW